jgi:hypothetical protein
MNLSWTLALVCFSSTNSYALIRVQAKKKKKGVGEVAQKVIMSVTMVKSRRRPSTLAIICAPFLLLLTCSSIDVHHAEGFCIRTTYTQHHTVASICRQRSTLLSLQEGNQNNNDNNNYSNDDAKTETKTKSDIDNSYSWAELQADEELRQLEFKSSMKRKNMLFLPQRISKAIYTLGWMFVITGIILNSFGFAYVEKPGGGLGKRIVLVQ